MATRTYYVVNISDAVFGELQDGGTAPTAANCAFGWQVAKTAVSTPFWRSRLGATAVASVASASSLIAATSGPTPGTGTGATTAGDSFSTPTALTGTYAAGAWTISFTTRPTTVTAVGRLRMRVWASVNANGSSAREL